MKTVHYAGKEQTFKEWAKATGIPASVIRTRLRRGWSVERTLTTSVGPKGKQPHNKVVEYQGRTLCLSEWSSETGLPLKLISERLINGWSAEKALTTPVRKAKK